MAWCQTKIGCGAIGGSGVFRSWEAGRVEEKEDESESLRRGERRKQNISSPLVQNEGQLTQLMH
jgi:hypothetical protein